MGCNRSLLLLCEQRCLAAIGLRVMSCKLIAEAGSGERGEIERFVLEVHLYLSLIQLRLICMQLCSECVCARAWVL